MSQACSVFDCSGPERGESQKERDKSLIASLAPCQRNMLPASVPPLTPRQHGLKVDCVEDLLNIDCCMAPTPRLLFSRSEVGLRICISNKLQALLMPGLGLHFENTALRELPRKQKRAELDLPLSSQLPEPTTPWGNGEKRPSNGVGGGGGQVELLVECDASKH